MNTQPIAVGCDHAGFELKEHLKEWLQSNGHEVKDFGTHSLDSVDYPDFVHPLASFVESDATRLGILICGSGNGVAITANKHAGIRAALCWSVEIAALARQHNNANIICVPSRFVSQTLADDMTRTFISTPFEEGRHANRVEKIKIH